MRADAMMEEPRRSFGCRLAVGALAFFGGAPSLFAAARQVKSHRVTIAQLRVTRSVKENLARMKPAFTQAARDKAQWLLFPEGMLSGYTGDFEQDEVAKAFAECAELTKENRVTALIGTSWKRADGSVENQVRMLGTRGEVLGSYAKRCLTYGDAKWARPGTGKLVFSANGIRFGALICNDLWVTPGFTDGPDPRLTLQQSRQGAQVIFQAIHSGSSQKYRGFHESNLFTRAAEAKCPIVTCNAFSKPAVNATSGVVGANFEYLAALPRDREAVETVEFTPAKRG